jgi:hypothetical protein
VWDCHVDLAADIGWVLYRMYQIYGDAKYRDKAIHVANVLVTNRVPGTATDSPWPYVVNSLTGANKSRYAASWDGALSLFDLLIANNHGDVAAYATARAALKNWLLTYPMQNGNWVDGHSDVGINGTNNWSTTCASDMCLYLFDNPGWDPNFRTNAFRLIQWAEDHFVNVGTPDNLPGQYHGAYVPAEQTAYLYRMGYQAARLGAQYALWYEASGNDAYKDRAYRCLAYNTYMMQANGQSSDGPTDTVGFWWSDCYGEAPRMYYYAMGAVPEWAPPNENHLLRSSSVVKAIAYTSASITYTTWDSASTEVFRLSSVPTNVFASGVALPQLTALANQGWTYDGAMGVLRVRHVNATQMQVVFDPALQPPTVSLDSPSDGASFTSPALVPLTASTNGSFAGVTNVEFFSGSTKIGQDTSSPFSLVWPNVPEGNYVLTAKATDATGLSRTSAPKTVTVNAPGGASVLGNTSEGATTDYITDNTGTYINANRHQAQSGATVTEIRAKVGAITGRYQCAIYADNGGSASTLLRPTATLTNVAAGWRTFPLASPLTLTNGSHYWLAIWSDDVNARVHADTGGTLGWAAYAFGTWPSPVTLSGSGAFTYCLYASGPPKTAFQQWKSNYGFPAAAPDDSDTDGDKQPLLLEYALGLDPSAKSIEGLPTGALSNGFLTLSYTKIKAATDVTCTVIAATKVTGPWRSDTNDVEQRWRVCDSLTAQTIIARDMTPVSNATSRFMRLKVTGP